MSNKMDREPFIACEFAKNKLFHFFFEMMDCIRTVSDEKNSERKIILWPEAQCSNSNEQQKVKP